MSFDDIPEDREETYECPQCTRGSIYFRNTTEQWECDNCEYVAGREL